MCVHVCACVRMCMCVYMWVSACVYMCVHMLYVCVHVCISMADMCMYVCACACVYVGMCICVCTRVYVCAHAFVCVENFDHPQPTLQELKNNNAMKERNLCIGKTNNEHFMHKTINMPKHGLTWNAFLHYEECVDVKYPSFHCTGSAKRFSVAMDSRSNSHKCTKPQVTIFYYRSHLFQALEMKPKVW